MVISIPVIGLVGFLIGYIYGFKVAKRRANEELDELANRLDDSRIKCNCVHDECKDN